MNISDFLHHTADRLPDHVAIYDEHGSMTYRELSDAVKALATHLESLGVVQGRGVGVMGANSRDFISMAFAVMQTGAVVMPISHTLSQDELAEMIAVAKLHFIIFDSSCHVFPGDADQLQVNQLKAVWNYWTNHGNIKQTVFAPHVPDAALIRFTSGTTGASKGVILSHLAIDERTAAANAMLKLNEYDKIHWVLSMAFHFVVSIILYIRYGCTIIINRDIMASVMLDEINRYKATMLYVSPLHIRLLESDLSKVEISSVRKVISTSTAISKEQCDLFKRRFGKLVSQAYGIIEIGLPVINLENADRHPDAIGYSAPGYQVEILDDAGAICEAGIIGNLAIRGPGMFDAYLDPPSLRAEVLQDGWFMTGDLAAKQRDGLIKVEGRKKSMINVAGNKVFPEEVEAVLERHPDVLLCRVKGYSHRMLGECVMAEVVLVGQAKADTEALISFCRKHLSVYKIPQKIQFVDSLSMTSSGKIARNQ